MRSLSITRKVVVLQLFSFCATIKMNFLIDKRKKKYFNDKLSQLSLNVDKHICISNKIKILVSGLKCLKMKIKIITFKIN